MKASMKAYVTVHVFKTAFCVEEVDNQTRLAGNMSKSMTIGYKGFRAVGKTRKIGAALYTLESMFSVCKLMDPANFVGGKIPSPERHILPREKVTFKEFIAILFINGNNIGEIETNGRKYQALHKAASKAKLCGKESNSVYDYMALVEVAKKIGWYAPPLSDADQRGESRKPALPAELDKQGLLSLVSIDNIDSEFEGVDGTRCLRYIATACTGFGGQLDYVTENGDYTLKCMKENNRLQQENNRIQQENNRLLRELLNIWKGEQSND